MSALVTPDWLEAHLDDPDLRVIESSIAKASYDEAHIPGARWVDHLELLRNGDDSSGLVLTPEQYAALMSRLGVTPSSTVVWYGDRHSSYAMRGFWTMDRYAHPGAVHVLEGGRERWLAERRPVTAGVPNVAPSSHPVPAERNDDSHASLQDIRDAITDDRTVILDVRSRDEYTGKNVRAKRGGHIPGAANVEWTDTTADDNVLKPLDQLRDMYEAQGVTPDKQIIAHCQLGVRASHTWFVLKHVLGYPDVKNYAGSWQEWGNLEDTPIDTPPSS